MSFESLIRPQKSPDSGSGGGGTPESNKPKNFHEAFLLYQQAKTQKERAVIFEEGLPLCKSFDEIIEFMDHLSSDSPELTTNPEDESVDIATEPDDSAVLDLNLYRELYAKMDKKIVEIYLSEIEKTGSIPELKALYQKLDDNSLVYPDGVCEIPTLRKWFELETTEAGLRELLTVIRNDFENQNLPKLVDLRKDIKAKLTSLKIYVGMESKEIHEFSLEEIRGLLKQIDGKEHLDLTVGERIENIKGELMSLTFMSGEKETLEGEEHEISYLLTLAGQRYKADGTEGRFVSKTFLTKDYDEGMFHSEEMADYVDDKWTNFTPHVEQTASMEQKEVMEEQVLQALDTKGIEDIETKELLIKYAIQCENDSEKKNPQDPNKAHFESALILAKLYSKTEKYKAYALESLEELAEGAHTISPEAVNEIEVLMNSLR